MDAVKEKHCSGDSSIVVDVVPYLDENEFTVSWKRWMMLGIVTLLNMSVAMAWLCFSPVAYKTGAYYDMSLLAVNTLSLIFMITAIPCGILCMWVLEKCGLRTCLLLCAWLGCIGSILRICSTIDDISREEKLVFLFTGQIVTSLGSVFGLYTPAKLAVLWFPENQRTIANTIAASANPIGIILTGIISPLFLHSDGTYDMRLMLITYASPLCAGALLTSVFVTSSTPTKPPSFGSQAPPSDKVFEGVKDVFHNKMFMLLALCLGHGIGLYSAFATLLEQVLCPWGYTDTMAGISGSVLTASGILGAIIISTIVDKTRRFSEALKLVYCLTSVGVLIFSLTHDIYIGYGIIGSVAVVGFFAFTIYPVGTELAAECTYPVGVSLCVGIIQLSGQLQSIILILLLSSTGTPMDPQDVIENDSQCHHVNGSGEEQQDDITYDMRVPTYIATGLISLMAIILTIFFRPEYRRMDAERMHEVEYQIRRKSLGDELKNGIGLANHFNSNFTNLSFSQNSSENGSITSTSLKPVSFDL